MPFSRVCCAKMYSLISFQAALVNLPDKFGLSHLDPELIFVHLQWWMPGRAWGRPGSEGCGGWNDDPCLCLPGLQLVQTAVLVFLCPHLSPPRLGSGALLGWQGFRRSLVLPVRPCPASCSALLSALPLQLPSSTASASASSRSASTLWKQEVGQLWGWACSGAAAGTGAVALLPFPWAE